MDRKVERYLARGGDGVKRPHHNTLRAYARRHGVAVYQSGGGNKKLVPVDKLVTKLRRKCNSCKGTRVLSGGKKCKKNKKGGRAQTVVRRKRRSNTTRKLKRAQKQTKNSGNSPFERCVKKVKEGQSLWCVAHNFPAYQKDPHGRPCVNPWAVCSSSMGRKKRRF